MNTPDQQAHLKADRSYILQKAFVRYRRIKSLLESQRSLEDKIFLENFEAAMYLWGLKSQGDTSEFMPEAGDG